MTTFRQYDDVAAIECDEAGKPLAGGEVIPCTVIKANDWSVTARRGDGATRLFLLDSRDRAWAGMGRWRLVPLCHRPGCDTPIVGTPVTDPDDPLRREFCTGECRDDAAEAWSVQHYGYGVAT